MSKISVDEKLVEHVAVLARLKLSQGELGSYVNHMKNVIEYFDLLDEVDVAGVTPLFNPVYHYFAQQKDQKYNSRRDEVKSSLGAKEILSNAPKQEENQFKLDSVIEEN